VTSKVKSAAIETLCRPIESFSH